MQKIQQLAAHPADGAAGVLGDQGRHLVEAAAGGFQGFAGHLRPFLLDGGQQGLEPLAEPFGAERRGVLIHGAARG